MPRGIPSLALVEHLRLPRRIAPVLVDRWLGGPDAPLSDRGREESILAKYQTVGSSKISRGDQ